MRMNMWSRILIALSFFSLTVHAAPPAAPEEGTRVLIRLAESSGSLPEAQKLVESLKVVGGEHLVKVLVHKSSGQQELTLDLWGDTVPQADIPQTLRDAFPVLASADIQVSSLDAKDFPKLEGRGELRRGPPGEGGKVKKVVKILKKE